MEAATQQTTADELPSLIDSVIADLDAALGRPPFPNPAEDRVLRLAQRLETLMHSAKEKNRISSLGASKPVTVTLPILCAAIREGSVDHSPSLPLCETLLAAFVPVCKLSTYPLQNIEKDMRAVLPRHSVALFEFSVASGSLTVEKFSELLGLSACVQNEAPKGKKVKHPKTNAKQLPSPSRPASELISTNDLVEPSSTLSRELWMAVLSAPLDKPCRDLLTSTVNSSAKFLRIVGEDGALAETLLSVYGDSLLPRLKPSSLLCSLDEHLLDYFVDLVQLHDARGALLADSQSLQNSAALTWNESRMKLLCASAHARSVRPRDANGSLITTVFLALVLLRRATTFSRETVETGLCRLWEAAFHAATVLHKAECAELAGDSQHGAPAENPFARVSSVTLAAGVVQVEPHEGKWLRPLAALAEQSVSYAREMYYCSYGDVGQSRHPCTGAATVETFVSEVSLPSLTCKTSAQSKLALLAAPPHTQRQGLSNAAKTGGKGKASKKPSSAAPPKGPADVATAQAVEPLTLPAFLQLNTHVAELCGLLLSDKPLLRRGLVDGLSQGLQFCVAFTPPQPLTGATWRKYLDVVTQTGWMHLQTQPGTVTPETRDCFCRAQDGSPRVAQDSWTPCKDALLCATATLGNAVWVTPYAIMALREPSTAGPQWVADFFTASLVNALLHACLLMRGPSDSVPSPLYPLSPASVLGLVCSLLTEEQLVRASGSLLEDSAASTVLPFLDSAVRICTVERDASGVDTATHGRLWADLLPRGVQCIQRLHDAASACAEERVAAEQAQQAWEMEKRQATILQRMKEAEATRRAHQEFTDRQAAVNVAKQQSKALVTEEYRHREEQRVGRLEREKRIRAAKREEALRTLREQNTKTKGQRESERHSRLQRYRARMESDFRISVFLEHLELPPTRNMKVREQLHAVAENITPDELLEFLVSGTATIPKDMVAGATTESDVVTGEAPETLKSGSSQEEVRTVQSAVPPLEERVVVTDFWKDVAATVNASAEADSGRGQASEGVRVQVFNNSEAYDRRLATTQTAPLQKSVTSAHSFHYCASSLLNLFCYAGGNEYGDLPAPLPALQLSVASRAVPKTVLEESGYANVRVGFMSLQERGLVKLQGGLARLTVLGFRYHFPFHDPDGMLEVRIRVNRERVGALLATKLEKTTVDGELSISEDEEDEEDGEEEDSDGEGWVPSRTGNRILPDDEFGI